MSGTSRSTLFVSPSRAATIALVARFFAPLTSTRPLSGRPPRIASVSPDNFSPAFVCVSSFDRAPSPRSVFIRWNLTCVFEGTAVSGPPGACATPGECPSLRNRLSLGNRQGPRPPRLAASLELRDLVFVAQSEPDVVEPFEKPPPSVIIDLERHLDVTDGGDRGARGRRSSLMPGSASIAAQMRSRSSSEMTPVSRPCLPELPRKMSANFGLSTTLKPKSRSAHTACSRLDPVPKSGPATRMLAPWYTGWLSTNSGSWRQAANSASSKPVLVTRLR